MEKIRLLVLLVAISFTINFSFQCKKNEQNYPNFMITRTIHIPVRFLSPLPELRPSDHPEILTLTDGSEDELPLGPKSFDVLEDGGLVITDPLQNRIVFYDSLGQYLDAWEIGFPVSRITWRDDDDFEVIKATSGDTFLLDDTGQLFSSPLRSKGLASQSDIGETKLLGLNRAVISRPRTKGKGQAIIEVNFKSDSTQMIALRNLGVDREGNTYVATETTPTQGKDTIDITKFIRKYSPEGKILCQINDISIDYYIHPEDEFRIKNGKVYQMQPKRSELRINVWNTN